ncbi:MAG: hypothetical protein PWQ56_64 [Patescibacteria group bacterium]|nr:hypothetical protein [Patescibacteria group bacterium]
MNKQIFIASLLALTFLFVGGIYANAGMQNQQQNQINSQGSGIQNQQQVNSNNGPNAGVQNQQQNQGENQQIQNNEQNGKMNQRRSRVANAVQEMLQVAERNGGVGEQIRTIAQNQNQNQEKIESSLAKVQNRNSLTRFIAGPNYGEINNAQKILEQNRQHIEQLNQIKNQIVNQVDQQQLLEQIQLLEQSNLEVEGSLEDAQKGFSLLGWLFKAFSK